MPATIVTASRDLLETDAAALAALSRRLGGHETAEDWRALLERPTAIGVGATVDGRLVGYAAGEVRGGFGMPGPVAWLEAFGIEVERRGGGIGRALLADFLERAARGGAARALTLVPVHDQILGPFLRLVGFRDEPLACLGRVL